MSLCMNVLNGTHTPYTQPFCGVFLSSDLAQKAEERTSLLSEKAPGGAEVRSIVFSAYIFVMTSNPLNFPSFSCLKLCSRHGFPPLALFVRFVMVSQEIGCV